MLFYSLSSLIVFSAVVKCKSFSKAAEILFMTQPGVSNHVAQLEAQTGLTLIKRGKGQFELTNEGKLMYRYAARMEKIAWELQDKLRAVRKDTAPTLCIGTTINYEKKVMPYLLATFQMRFPDIKIKLDAGPSMEMAKRLLSGRNEVIIIANQNTSKKIQSFPFVREELVLVASKDHPLAGKERVSLSDICSYPFIIREEGSATRNAVLAAFSKMNVTPSVLIEANSAEFIKEWVSQGKGVSILIQRAIYDEEDSSITTVPLLEPLFLEVSVLYLKSKQHIPTVERFIEYLKEIRMAAMPSAKTVGGKKH